MQLINIMAAAMPGMAAFFINTMQVHSFGHLGMELTLVPAYGIRYLMSLIQDEEKLTQRELDKARKTPIIEWARQIPPIVFVYAVVLPICPSCQCKTFLPSARLSDCQVRTLHVLDLDCFFFSPTLYYKHGTFWGGLLWLVLSRL